MLQFFGSGKSTIDLKGLRGLAYSENIYSVRPDIITVVHFFHEYVDLDPGKEIEVSVATDLPPNANVHTIKATLYVADSTKNPAPQEAKIGIKKNNDAEDSYQVKVDTPNRPTNIQIRLDQGDPIWNFGGTLVEFEYELPDFSEALNIYLDRVQPENGRIALRFLIKSDTAGRAGISIARSQYEFTQIQTQSWINELDSTVRLDRNLTLEFSSIERIPLDPVSDLATGASLLNIKFDAAGELGSERLWGSVASSAGNDFATISSQYSIAQLIQVDQPISCAGLSLLVHSDSQSELYLELQSDLNGFPSAQVPLVKANLNLEASDPSKPSAWIYVPFEQPADLLAATPYWIVVKGIRGVVNLSLELNTVESSGLILVNRGGAFWRRLHTNSGPSPTGMIRLVYIPEPDTNIAALEIVEESSGISRRVDATENPQNIVVEFPQGSIAGSPVLVVRSYARGTITLANIIQEYSVRNHQRKLE